MATYFDTLYLRMQLAPMIEALTTAGGDLRDYYDAKGDRGNYAGQDVEDLHHTLLLAVAALEDVAAVARRM